MTIRTPADEQQLRKSGTILSATLMQVKAAVRPGVRAAELDQLAERLIRAAGGRPAFKHYNGFPAALCVSINDEIVHGVPTAEVIIRDGDVVKLDLGVNYNGYYTDKATTVAVGEIDFEARRMIAVNKKALKIAIVNAKAGKKTGDIGNAVERYVEKQNFGVVRELCGHGVGKAVHEQPDIPNYGYRNSGDVLREGMVIAIEPMVTMGDWRVKETKTGSFKTRDGSLAAHFEDTVIVRNGHAEIIT